MLINYNLKKVIRLDELKLKNVAFIYQGKIKTIDDRQLYTVQSSNFSLKSSFN